MSLPHAGVSPPPWARAGSLYEIAQRHVHTVVANCGVNAMCFSSLSFLCFFFIC